MSFNNKSQYFCAVETGNISLFALITVNTTARLIAATCNAAIDVV